MCGVAGLLRLDDRIPGDSLASAIRRMTDAVAHRGPDGSGVKLFAPSADGWRECEGNWATARLALGHRRLSILDLSDAGAQPMRRGPLWVTYNGEIYNYLELRAELASRGAEFRSESDTEVLLAAFEHWREGAFERLRGMFGFVLVDTRARRVWVCRDRLGIKPLYIARASSWIAFVSEPKQIAHAPGARLKARPEALADYLQTGWEPADRSFFADVEPVAPGTFRSIDLDTGAMSPPAPYWKPERIAPHVEDPHEAALRVRSALEDSVRVHLRSDVPVGCALSGGVDSASVAVLASRALPSDLRLHAFSITFPGFERDERPWIEQSVAASRAIAHYHTPSADDLAGDFDRFIWCHDEPVGSLSQYAAYTVARQARAHGVPVSLNGQGGDEVLGGYWQSYFAYLAGMRGLSGRAGAAREVLRSLGPGGNPELVAQAPAMARRALSRLRPARSLELRAISGGGEVGGGSRRMVESVLTMDDRERRIFEIRGLTLPRLLKWDDRNFMAFSVESRYPFLDHVFIEACLELQRSVLLRAGWTKDVLRTALSDVLPPTVARRRAKVGFETPQAQWLAGPLARWVDRLMQQDSPLWAFVERGAARSLAVRAERTGERELHEALFRLVCADRWMRVLSVETSA